MHGGGLYPSAYTFDDRLSLTSVSLRSASVAIWSGGLFSIQALKVGLMHPA